MYIKKLQFQATLFIFKTHATEQTTYTVLYMFTQLLFWAGNQDNHQTRPILTTQETLCETNRNAVFLKENTIILWE